MVGAAPYPLPPLPTPGGPGPAVVGCAPRQSLPVCGRGLHPAARPGAGGHDPALDVGLGRVTRCSQWHGAIRGGQTPVSSTLALVQSVQRGSSFELDPAMQDSPVQQIPPAAHSGIGLTWDLSGR